MAFVPARRQPGRLGAAEGVADFDKRVHRVFFDRTSIPAGRKWRDVLDEEIGAADVLLAVIGPRFETTSLHGEMDFVRLELVTAHRAEKLFVPILVNDARLPGRESLPNDLHWLVDWQAFELHPSTFDRDVRYLLDDLAKLESGLPDTEPTRLDPQTPTLRMRPEPTRPEYRGLWVDEHPDNNERERGVLEDFGVEFDLAISTSEAMRKLARRPPARRRHSPEPHSDRRLGRSTTMRTQPMDGPSTVATSIPRFAPARPTAVAPIKGSAISGTTPGCGA